MSDDERPDINQLIEHYGGRTKNRSKYVTPCIFHGPDRSPSMSVDTDRQLFNCMACLTKGDSYTVIKIKEGLDDFKDQVAFAASLGLATGQGGEDEARGSSHGGSRTNPRRPGTGGGGGYTPRWRRPS